MTAAETPSAAGATDLGRAPLEEILVALRVDVRTGLWDAEAEARLRQYGANEVPEQKPQPLREFLKKFWGLSAWMLELIIVISWLLGKYADLVIVCALLLVNAIVSLVQERRASGVIDTLRRRLQVTARVRRDGGWQLIPARGLVPGDVVRLRAGDFAPADGRTIAGELSVDQAALIGESLEVDKRSADLLYSGSVVRRGEATAVVILTGTRTFFGRATELVQRARPKLHVEDVVASVVRRLFVIVGVLVVLALAVSALRGFSLLEVLPLALVLLMSAVPVALPVMFTVSTAVGAAELAKKGVLVTRLSAAEDAATMDVLCVDKTGTITMNRLGITGVIPQDGFTREDVVLYGALASEEANQDPIDLAFFAAARHPGITGQLSSAKLIRFTPFDARTRRTEALIEQGGGRVRVLKGAVSVVAGECGVDGTRLIDLEGRAGAEAEKALHTFTFQTLFYFALFSILSMREGRRFWASRPSGTLTLVLALDAVVGTALSMIGVPGLAPLPWRETLAVFSYAMICCLLVNDLLKAALTKRVGLQT